MALMDKLKDVTEKAAEKATEVGGVAAEKISELLEEYRSAVAALETFGFTVGKFNVGMGLLPEIRTTIDGSLEAIDSAELQELIEKNEQKKILVTCLQALVMAKDFQQRADLMQFQKVTLDLKLGIPPKITFDLHA